MTDPDHIDRLVRAMVETFAFQSFFEHTHIWVETRAIALELGGDLGEKIKADEQRRADEAAERAESEKVSEDERRQEEIDLLAQLKAKYEDE